MSRKNEAETTKNKKNKVTQPQQGQDTLTDEEADNEERKRNRKNIRGGLLTMTHTKTK